MPTLKRYNRFVPNLTREDGSAFEEIMEEKAKSGKKSSSRFCKGYQILFENINAYMLLISKIFRDYQNSIYIADICNFNWL